MSGTKGPVGGLLSVRNSEVLHDHALDPVYPLIPPNTDYASAYTVGTYSIPGSYGNSPYIRVNTSGGLVTLNLTPGAIGQTMIVEHETIGNTVVIQTGTATVDPPGAYTKIRLVGVEQQYVTLVYRIDTAGTEAWRPIAWCPGTSTIFYT